MRKQNDKLYQCFERHLGSFEGQDEIHEKFILKVVEDYLRDLQQKGHIAAQHEQEIREDLETEVRDMLRKKTYGHLNLKNYRTKNS